jgi:alpha-maltose-1-phosphate synthase
MILTVGGDATSKGAQEVMQALALIDAEAPDWRYVCKVWPQPRTVEQNLIDLQLAAHLGIGKKVSLLHQRGLAQFHALLVGRLRYLRRAVAAGGFRNDSGGG